MGHDQESGILFSAFFLADGTERNAVGSKDFGEFSEHPDDVDDSHVDVESGGDVTKVGNGQVGVGGFAGGTTAEHFIPAGAHNIAEDSGCSGIPTGTIAVEHEPAGGLSFDKDGIEAFVHVGQGMVAGYEGGVDAGGDGFVAGFVLEPVTDCEELNGVARGLRGLNIVGGDIRDAFAVHVVGGDAGVEGEGGEDSGFGCGVVAFHVGGGVGFGVAESGGLGEHIVVGGTGGVHGVEDEVGGAIDNAGDGLDLVASEGAAERPNNGNGCGDGGFEVKVDAGLVGGFGEFGGVGRDEGLVGGDNGFAAAEGTEHEFARVVDAADDFDHEVYVVAFDEAAGVVGEEP